MHIVVAASAPLHRPAVDDGGRASDRAPAHPAGGMARYSSLEQGRDLGPRLVELVAPDIAQREECMVVATTGDRFGALQAVRFARQALRTDLITSSVHAVSPLRLSVVVDALQQIDIRGLLPGAWHLAALDVLIAQSCSVMVAHRVTRLQEPRPSFAQRWAIPSRTRRFVTTESSAGAVIERVAPGAAAPPLLVPVDLTGTRTVSLARGTRDLDLGHIIDAIDPVGVVEVANDPSWWRRWSSPQVTELVVTPADLETVRTRVSRDSPPSWLCSWCGVRITDLAGCRFCGADFRGARERSTEGLDRHSVRHRAAEPGRQSRMAE